MVDLSIVFCKRLPVAMLDCNYIFTLEALPSKKKTNKQVRIIPYMCIYHCVFIIHIIYIYIHIHIHVTYSSFVLQQISINKGIYIYTYVKTNNLINLDQLWFNIPLLSSTRRFFGNLPSPPLWKTLRWSNVPPQRLLLCFGTSENFLYFNEWVQGNI